MQLIATAEGIDVLVREGARDLRDGARCSRGGRRDSPVSEGGGGDRPGQEPRADPRYGVDIDESTIPQEAGMNERAVSFTKGCYVGQETVARLHYRGKPNRHLRGLRFLEPAAAPPAVRGEELRLGDRPGGA